MRIDAAATQTVFGRLCHQVVRIVGRVRKGPFLERRFSGLSSASKSESATPSSGTKRISLSCGGVHARRTKRQLANCFRWRTSKQILPGFRARRPGSLE
jgi:hypothetical protein